MCRLACRWIVGSLWTNVHCRNKTASFNAVLPVASLPVCSVARRPNFVVDCFSCHNSTWDNLMWFWMCSFSGCKTAWYGSRCDLPCSETCRPDHLEQSTCHATKSRVCSLSLDYRNLLLAGCPMQFLDTLQEVQNTAARLICKAQGTVACSTPITVPTAFVSVSVTISHLQFT